jgi:hypothetical protein
MPELRNEHAHNMMRMSVFCSQGRNHVEQFTGKFQSVIPKKRDFINASSSVWEKSGLNFANTRFEGNPSKLSLFPTQPSPNSALFIF